MVNVRPFFVTAVTLFESVYLVCKVNPVLSGHSKIDKTKVLKTNGRLIKVESICRILSLNILQYI